MTSSSPSTNNNQSLSSPPSSPTIENQLTRTNITDVVDMMKTCNINKTENPNLSNIAIITRCYFIQTSQWTQSTWGLLDGTKRETINYSFKDYPHNSYKIIINNYNYSTIRAKDQRSFVYGLCRLEDFLLKNNIKEVFAHKTIINELLNHLPTSLLNQVIFRPTCNLSQGVYISQYCQQSRNHNSINCSLCIYETIRSDILSKNKVQHQTV